MYIPKKNYKEETLENGVGRTVLSYGDSLMTVRFNFKKGQVGDVHQHKHEQSTYILSGKFEFEINGVKHICEEGDSLFFLSNTPHGCVCLSDGILIDSFTPLRKDFLK
ncbi:MAG: cupin domain-containing protein [Alphaproteobacteria bacterium]|jgi:quercetin dioxygenase-like cupin family protein|nr:cupin domain-containing protein [Alphaproteobacteria bacterium]